MIQSSAGDGVDSLLLEQMPMQAETVPVGDTGFPRGNFAYEQRELLRIFTRMNANVCRWYCTRTCTLDRQNKR